MPYIQDRLVHDADAHIMETPEMLEAYVEPQWREKVQALDVFKSVAGYHDRMPQVLARLGNGYAEVAMLSLVDTLAAWQNWAQRGIERLEEW